MILHCVKIVQKILAKSKNAPINTFKKGEMREK